MVKTFEKKQYSGLKELELTELMKNYNKSIVAEAVAKKRNIREILDFGAGIGTLAVIFKERFGVNVRCLEIDVFGQKQLIARGFDVYKNLAEVKANVDFIFSSNVLEHIEDDEQVLRELSNKLNAGGHMFLYLPAKMFLWSDLDVNVGHFRRYEIKEIRDKCLKNGLMVKKIHYADFLGFFASSLIKIFGYNDSAGIGSPHSLLFYDRFIFPISRIIDKLGGKWVTGKNIIVFCEKK